ncbi:energy transducer TonB family protein [Methylocapsa palsarum]|uniref:Colicin import membrane protein n=1 Tax=Methylocapsa palsarum TaxID=1612308 RepID=A0A1I3YDI8_9HYPH|nr:TonB family protein [Methylocapsa palsarum]SFK29840.1 colicin import membrane protein [Methylocapsa palsarum]
MADHSSQTNVPIPTPPQGLAERNGSAAGGSLISEPTETRPSPPRGDESWAWIVAAALVFHGLIGLFLVLADRAPVESPSVKEIPVEVVAAAPDPAKTPPPAPQEQKQPPEAAQAEKNAPQNVKKAEPEPESKTEPKAESRPAPNEKPKPAEEQKRPPEPKPKPAQRAKTESSAAAGKSAARDAAAGKGAAQEESEHSAPGAARTAPAAQLPFDLGPPIFHAVAVPMPVEGDGELVNYKIIVFGMLERVKHFPDAAAARGAHGASVVVFSLDDAGGVKSVSLFRSSGDPDLDAESLDVVTRAAPFPAPPAGAQHDFAAEITFGMRPLPDR